MTLNRAYAVASLGETVQMAGGNYDYVNVQDYPPKDGSTCVSDPASGACVVVVAAPNSTVTIGSLTLGKDRTVPGPSGLVFLSGGSQRIVSRDTTLWQAAQTALVGMSHRNYFMSGGSWVTLNGGEVGPENTSDGTHPEIQRVYGTRPCRCPRTCGSRTSTSTTSTPPPPRRTSTASRSRTGPTCRSSATASSAAARSDCG